MPGRDAYLDGLLRSRIDHALGSRLELGGCQRKRRSAAPREEA